MEKRVSKKIKNKTNKKTPERYSTGTEPHWIASLTDDYRAYVRALAWTESWRAVNSGGHTQAFVRQLGLTQVQLCYFRIPCPYIIPRDKLRKR